MAKQGICIICSHPLPLKGGRGRPRQTHDECAPLLQAVQRLEKAIPLVPASRRAGAIKGLRSRIFAEINIAVAREGRQARRRKAAHEEG